MSATLFRVAVHEAGPYAAAIAFGIPIVAVTIEGDVPHLQRGHYRAPADTGLEAMCILVLAGPAAEQHFCGPITDGSDQIDEQMAREYLAHRFDALRIGIDIAHFRDAAHRLVRIPWAQKRVCLIADALLRHGTLSGEAA